MNKNQQRAQKIREIVKILISFSIAAIWINWLIVPVVVFWLALAKIQISEAMKPKEKTGFENLFAEIDEVIAEKVKKNKG